MAELQTSEKKLTVKIVYYGPALSGKTTNLMQLHDIILPRKRGELMTLETSGDRTLFFDLLPLMGKTSEGYKIKIKLFTVPGQVAHDATRKAVLSRTDGVVFVADSQLTQSVNNSISFENLEKNAGRVGIDFDTLPLVVQYNKRDLKDIIDEKEVRGLWKQTHIPVQFSTAIHGQGVKETFVSVLKEVYRNLNQKLNMESGLKITEDEFLSVANM
ncbi:MAG: GTPase [Proteobacteria bacterium]|nr:GTPase [Pseudomonadota bacterium]